MKRTLALLVFALALLWLGWYLYSSSERADLAVPQHEDFFIVDTLTIDSLEVKYADWTRLAKIDGRWQVYADGYMFPADTGLLHSLLSTTNSMVLENMISRSPSKFAKFEVDTIRGRVMRFFGDGQPLAEFIIGKLSPGVSHTYVRRLGSDSVYLARGRFQQLYTMMPDQWKTRAIIDCDSSTVQSVRWIRPNNEIQLARTEGGPWLVSSSDQPQAVATDSTSIGRLMGKLCPLYTMAFLPAGSKDTPTFDKIGLQLIVSRFNGAADTILWEDVPEDENRMPARFARQDRPVLLFGRQRVDEVAPPYDSLIAK